MCGRDGRSGEDGGCAVIIPGNTGEAVRTRSADLGVVILVDDLCGIRFLGLFNGGMILAGSHIRYTPEGVVGDHGLDEIVEGRHVLDRSRKSADRTLDLCILYEICHSLLPPSGPWAE